MEEIPEALRFRHIRYVKDGRFVKVKRRFLSHQALHSFLEKTQYEDVYYSVAHYLNPQKVGPKQQNLEEIFLKADLVFDIDLDGPLERVVEKGLEEVRQVLKIGKKQRWNLSYMAFSGKKGFHVVFQDPVIYQRKWPWEREEEALSYRERILSLFKDVALDEKVTLDTRRILRLPYSYHSQTHYQCLPFQKLNPKHLIQSIKKSFNLKRWGTLSLRAMTRASLSLTIPGLGRSVPHPPKPLLAASSTIPKTKRHALIMEFSRMPPSLPYPHLILKHHHYILFSPVAVDKEHYLKLLRKHKASNLNAFLKYGHGLLPLNAKPLKKHTNFPPNLWYSKPHLQLFSRITNHSLPKLKTIGKDLIIRGLLEE
ncbi:MAG: hypothetical protein GXN92_01520 [Candidatus Micrarchaeota archaeon]|nr:hypothetical protein [Candidatus Micrarchaeota archaeon]